MITEKELQERRIAAMKQRDAVLRGVLDIVMSGAQSIAKENKSAVEPEHIRLSAESVMKGIKKSLVDVKGDGREQLLREKEIVSTMLPPSLDGDALKDEIQAAIDGGAADIGAMMKALRQKHKNTFDGAEANAIFRALKQ